jgi:methylenetetrahydrofolate--tRNA-(uracil-5-)-methyltransferase
VKATQQELAIIGAGLAGTEAAWQVANAGVRVELWEMRPNTLTPGPQDRRFRRVGLQQFFENRKPE